MNARQSAGAGGLPAGPDVQVTVVVATYNRPQLLRAAITSVQKQTLRSWRLLVIGDACDELTGQVMASFSDSRIEYINLAARFGEQSGPNSVGMRLARSDYIALLNHDDVWLPDHLERGLEQLAENRADFCISRAAAPVYDAGREQLIFKFLSPVGRTLMSAFWLLNRPFEPCSTYIFTAHAARKLGDWPSALSCYRVPLHVWLLRLWRSRLKVFFDDEITVMRGTAYPPAGSTKLVYEVESTQHEYLSQLVSEHSGDDIRSRIAADQPTEEPAERFLLVQQIRSPKRQRWFRWLVNPWSARLYYLSGLDTFSLFCKFTGRTRGERMRSASIARVGADHIASHSPAVLAREIEESNV